MLFSKLKTPFFKNFYFIFFFIFFLPRQLPRLPQCKLRLWFMRKYPIGNQHNELKFALLAVLNFIKDFCIDKTKMHALISCLASVIVILYFIQNVEH